MPRLRRRLLNLLTARSLLLCVALCALWVRSYQALDFVRWSGTRRLMSVAGAEGQLVVTYCAVQGPEAAPADRGIVRYATSPRAASVRPLPSDTPHFRWGRLALATGQTLYQRRGPVEAGQSMYYKCAVYHLYVPHWAPTVAALVLPAVFLTRVLLPPVRFRVGLCPACRYDLTGNVSGVCPE